MKKAVHARFMTGAKKSPRSKLLAAVPFRAVAAPPPQFAVVPPKLDVWGNSTYGDCVSAEEAFAKAWWAVNCGLSELFAAEAEVVAFARRFGYLNGATLTEVMDTMARYGMSIGAATFKDGGYAGVDYSDEGVLKSALTVGPVKIAIDAAALPNDAGNRNGWHDAGGSVGQYPDTDHCVGLGGYGPASYLFGLLGVPVPSGVNPGTVGYLLFTWGTLGFVDHAWIMSTTTEAWVRNPTTVGQSPAPAPGPVPLPPAPIPNPDPPVPTPTPAGPQFGVPYQATLTAPGLFGPHTQRVSITLSAPKKAGFTLPDLQAMVADVLALLAEDNTKQVEQAVWQVIQDAMSKQYGRLLADVLRSWPATLLLVKEVTALVEKWRHTANAGVSATAGSWFSDHAQQLIQLLEDLLRLAA